MPLKCTIGGVDVSEYLKLPLVTAPGGDGMVGKATLILDQQAGGLDLRPMMDVRVWQTFNDAGAGIAPRGRLFGGIVGPRDTTNAGTTKQWKLGCWDYNVILKRSVRRAAPVHAVTLAAGTLAAQMIQLFGILQGSSDIQIDATNFVADLYATMPAVTYPGGKRFEWYVQQLLIKVHELDPAIIPGYFMGVDTVTSGAGASFGVPVLNVYDTALTPLTIYDFSDTPTGAEKSVFPEFRRVTDPQAMVQYQQSHWSGVYFHAQDDTSQAAYPNPYVDQVGDGTGFWAAEVIEDTQSATADEAQAVVDRLIAAKGAPRDTFVWTTELRLLPGEYVGLKWDLEGIPSMTPMRIAAATYTWEPPNTVVSQLTLNTRRLGLFDDGTGGYFAPPIEGDTVPPLPPADFDITAQEYDPERDLTLIQFAIVASPSPDAIGYIIDGFVDGRVYEQDVGTDLTPMLTFPPNVSYSFQAKAYDRAENTSDATPASPLTGTTLQIGHRDVPNPSFESIADDFLIPRYWHETGFSDGSVTRSSDNPASGAFSMWLYTADATELAEAECEQFIPLGHTTQARNLKFIAIADVDGVELTGRVIYWEWNGTNFVGVSSPAAVDFVINDTSAEFSAPIPPEPGMRFASIRFSQDGADNGEASVWIDDVEFEPINDTIDYGDSTVTEAKLSESVRNTLANVGDQISLLDRARHASGWRNLGLLTNDAFREASIVYQGGEYYVFYTGVYETEQTDVLHDATLEGIVTGTHVADIVPLKYPSVVYDPVTQVWHLWGLKTTGGVVTQHYTSLSPTSGWAYSDDVDDVLLIDMGFQKHPTNGYWYGIGFLNAGGSTLQLLRASVPEGPWTNLGNVFADVGNPPFALSARPDPNLAFTGGRDYIFFSGAPSTVLTQNYFPSICEIDLAAGRVIGTPVALLDERDPWMVDGEPAGTRGISDLAFLRVPGEPDRIFAWANDGEVTTTDDWGWGCLELSKTDIPSDGRKHTDLVRIDFKRGIDLATGIRPVTRANTEWRDNALVITADEGGAHGYLSQQYIDDFTMYADFTVDGPQAANAMVGVILGPTYAAGPAITIDLDSDDIRAVVQASDDTAIVLTSGITTLPGRRYRVTLRRVSGVCTLWVDGVLVDTDTLTELVTDAQVWSMGAYITLTEPEVYPFIGTIHEFWCTGQALPLGELAVYQPPAFVGARYKTDAGQSIANNTVTIVNYEDQDYDPHSCVTTGASWKFTAPIAGFYRVGGMITFNTTANWAASESADLDLYKNGARVCNLDRNDNVISSSVIKTLSGCTEIYLVAGDYVDLRAFQQSGAALALFGAQENNYVTVSRIG